MKQYIRHALILLTLLLTACATSDSTLDEGLLSDKPCKAPCWNGLTPGQSTGKDVDQFIDNLNPKLWASRSGKVYETGCKLVKIGDKPGIVVEAAVNFNIDHGELIYIQSFHNGMPNLKQITDHLGPPEYFKALNVKGPDGSFYSVDIYYPNQGVTFRVSVTNKDLGFIKPGMRVTDIQYFEPGTLLDYFVAKYGCSSGREVAEQYGQIDINKYIQPWTGFGSVQVIDAR